MLGMLSVLGCVELRRSNAFALTSTQPTSFSVSPGSAPPFHAMGRYGTAEGDSALFGFIGDAKLSSDGSVLVVEPNEHRVVRVSAEGKVIRVYGAKGAGPGELLAPYRLAVRGAELSVYDRTLGRIVVFDTAGPFLRSQSAGAAMLLGDIVPVARSSYVVTGPVGSQIGPLGILDSSGVVRAVKGISRPSPELALPGGGEPGRLCGRSDGSVIYFNPWTYELVAIDPTTAAVRWSRRFESEEVVSVPFGADPKRQAQKIAPLGIACTSSRIWVAYMTLDRRQVNYDELSSDGRALRRRVYKTAEDVSYPGFLSDARTGRLLTFRNRPWSFLVLYGVPEEGR
ncbi:MAG: hypothetical protein ACK5Y5_10695 [Gemmatimonas sp.]|uniref:hypothetical protein n=1 Tax=Gemmatimonas sp. TaxID=1962908 RepID=UPI00391F3B93